MAYKDFALLNQRNMYAYAAGDADATRRLFFVFLKKLKKSGQLDYFKYPVMALSKSLILAAQHGVRVDYEKVAELISLVTRGRDFYLDKMIIFLSDTSFNPRSVPSLRSVLFEDLNLTPVILTAKGLPSTSVEATSELIKMNSRNKRGLEFIELLVLYRKLDKLLSTYLGKIRGFCDEDGYVHPRFIVGATVSGRVSVKDPPLTTLPKDTEYETHQGKTLISVRSIFIPSEDSVWIHVDFSQIELVVSAFLSRDPVMMKAYWDGIDLHDLTMREINGKDYISSEMAGDDPVLIAKRASQRRDAKIVNFSIIYLAKPYNTARILGYSVEKVQGIMDQMFFKFSGLHKYLLSVPGIVARTGVLKSPFGRLRHFHELSSFAPTGDRGHQDRQAVNWNPQSCGAELTFRALNRISAIFRERRLVTSPVNLVYDAIEFDARKSELDQVIPVIIKEVSRPVPQFDNYSFGFEIGVGVNMSDAEKNAKKVANPWKTV